MVVNEDKIFSLLRILSWNLQFYQVLLKSLEDADMLELTRNAIQQNILACQMFIEKTEPTSVQEDKEAELAVPPGVLPQIEELERIYDTTADDDTSDT